jgi:uncharacterized protein (TIGR02266 family)
MTQDTRKDRRVKIVSLNVRYKSATVDEFIENHAHDVSRGGIYIKTANPFPPGTLLKFEIRLASDQAVIAGVGRVVWKRDAASSNGERPAGMGVKFIKIDEPSKSVIDKLVNTRADAGKAYEAEAEVPTAVAEVPVVKPTPPPAAAAAKLTPMGGVSALPPRKAPMLGLGVATSASPPGPDAPAPSHAPAAAAPRPAPAAAAAPPPRAASSGQGMFPSAQAIEDDAAPKQEQTVMKQAAELLEEALREAGGSMEEIGTNPLFSSPGPTPAPASAASAHAPGAEDRKLSPAPVEAKKASLPPLEVKTPSVERAGVEKAKEADEAAKARAMVSGISPAPRKLQSDPPPRTARETPGAKGSTPAPAVGQAEKKGGGGGVFILLFVAVVAVGGAALLFKDKLFGGEEAPVPPPTQTAATTATAKPTVSAPPSATTTEAPSASTAPAGSASGAPTPSASAAPSATAAATSTAAAATATAAVPTATATATAQPKPTATATATATAVPKPTATATATAAATETATAAPKPKPKPKPADDNPY